MDVLRWWFTLNYDGIRTNPARDTFVMLRRLALLAWIGSHIEVDTAQELAPKFAPVTAELAEKFLSGH